MTPGDAAEPDEAFSDAAEDEAVTPVADALLSHMPGRQRELRAEAAKAEERAAQIMRKLGFPEAKATQASADKGIDVVAPAAVAQVKWQSKPVGRPSTQQLAGAWLQRNSRWRRNEKMLYFAKAGYSRAAIEYADDVGMVLFQFADKGRVAAANKHAVAFQKSYPSVVAKRVEPKTDPRPTRWHRRVEDVLVFALLVLVPLLMVGGGCYLAYLGIRDLLIGAVASGAGFLAGGIALIAVLVLSIWWLGRLDE
ncbi:restriction endonuclease [Gordonia sp. ABSL49_1]|uniref:restriction endonuclease n=1 Tax=Gordonia sp. ABSL49_1 TaxID=2920941 RepID=UPI001F10B6A9|nr:restriction endonuclease [Gordonia sp. ABSL49_1]MCH5643480.1 restriction endonuclease [Gordonia sp. ABSL49_1]